MKIAANYNYQVFRANDKSRSFMGDVSDAIDTTADIMKAAKVAIDTPEEAAVKVLSDQIDNVATSKKVPNWMKKGLNYISAVLVTGGTAYGIYKVPGGARKLLSKFKFGQSLLDFAHSGKELLISGVKALKLDSLKNKVMGGLSSVKDFVAKKLPENITKSLSEYKTKLHLDELTTTKAIKGAVAGLFGLSAGKKVLDRNDKIQEKPQDINEEFEEDNEVVDSETADDYEDAA